MRKKQLFTLLLAGVLATGSIPATVLAEAEAGIESQALETETGAGEQGAETPAQEAPTEAPTQAPTEAPTQAPTEAPTQAPTEAPTEAPAQEAPTQAPTEASTETPQQTEAPKKTKDAAAPTVTPTEVPKDGLNPETAVETLEEFKDAMSRASEQGVSVEDPNGFVYVKGAIALDSTITVTKGHIKIIAADNMEITRADGFTGDMFTISGTGTGVTFSTENGMTLSLNGKAVTGGTETTAAGSIIRVESGAAIAINDNVSLTGNKNAGAANDGQGGAIYNAGTLNLNGGTISGNTAVTGGAVYNAGLIDIQGNVTVEGNTDMSEAPVANNIYLQAGKVINVVNTLTNTPLIGVTVEDPTEGRSVITAAEGIALADNVAKFGYDVSGYTLNEDGTLKTPAATVTPSVTPSVAPSVTPSPTDVPTATPTPTTAPAEKPVVKYNKITWDSRTSVQVDLISSAAGTYYYAFKAGKDELLENDFSAGEKTQPDGSFSISGNELNADKKAVLYVKVKDTNGTASEVMKIVLDDVPEFPRPEKQEPTEDPKPTHTPVIPAVTDSKVTGLENPLEFWPGKFYDFRVVGAGSDNQNPGEGDVYWKPLYWSTVKNPSDGQKHTSWKIGAESGIQAANTYNLYIAFRKMVYKDGAWTATEDIETMVTQFRSKAITVTPTGTVTPSGTPGAGNSGWNSDGTVDGADEHDDDDTTTGTSTSSGANTADEAPVGGMAGLLAFSLLTGSYIIVRKRKKETAKK